MAISENYKILIVFTDKSVYLASEISILDDDENKQSLVYDGKSLDMCYIRHISLINIATLIQN